MKGVVDKKYIVKEGNMTYLNGVNGSDGLLKFVFPIGSVVNIFPPDTSKTTLVKYTPSDLVVMGYEGGILIVDRELSYGGGNVCLNKVSPYDVFLDIKKNRNIKLKKLLEK